MKLTHEEFAAASAYEHELRVAVRSKYLRNVGRSGLAVLVPIYERITGTRQRMNPNCAACILDLLERLGAIYFAEKAEHEQPSEAPAADTPESAPEIPARRRNRRASTQE